MTRTISRRFCILLALVLLFALLPATSLAAGTDEHNTHDGITFEPWESDNSLPDTPGSYYLTKDVILTQDNPTWNVPEGTVNLCLNGHGIIGYGYYATGSLGSRNYPVIIITDDRTLNLYDCGKTEHFFSESTDSSTPGMAIIDSSGNYTFKGGYITCGSGGNNGGGVYIGGDKGNATFNMYDGTIIGNYATNGGAGVRVNYGVFNMLGGRICYNASSSSAGVRVKNSRARMTMHGGTIDNNNAFSNEAGKGGGGIGIDDGDAEVVLIGGEIKANTAAGDGGGIHIAGNATIGLIISGNPVISGNTAAGKGGGIYFAGNATASLTISGNPNISGNTGDGSPNNVYLTNGKTIRIGGNLLKDVRIPVTTEAKPQAGSPVTITGALGDDATVANFTSDDPDYKVARNGDSAVLVPCAEAVTVSVSADPSEGGTVIGADTYLKGSNATVTATPNEGYVFVGMTKDGNAVENPFTFKADADASFVASFEKQVFTVEFLGADGKSLQKSEVKYGKAPEYTGETPEKEPDVDHHYSFDGWNPQPNVDEPVDLEKECIKGVTTYYAIFTGTKHTFVDHPAAAATCTENGNSAYKVCSECGIFVAEDEEGRNKIIQEGSWVIPKKGHSWKFDPSAGENGFTWTGSDTDGYTAAVANYICTNDNAHTQTAEAELNIETTDATCETSGSVVYTATVSSDKTPDGKALTATKTVEVAALGHNWSDWKVVKEPEAGKEGERIRTCSRCEKTETEAIEALPVPIVYTVTEGADSSWTKGNSEGITLTVKRSENDEDCFSHYKQTLIDGTAVSVSAESGSTVVSISAETLEALSTGSHTITVVFNDGEAETTLTLTENTEPEDQDVPLTGDDTRLPLWIAIQALSIICLASVFVFGRKSIFKK